MRCAAATSAASPWALRHGAVVMLVLLATVCLNVYLYVIIPKGFFPQQDTGRLIGGIQADQSISFQAMRQKLAELHRRSCAPIRRSRTSSRFTGGAQRNSGSMFVALKPLAERKEIGRPGDRAAARQARARSRARTSSCSRCRTSASAAGRPMRSTSTRCRRDDLAELRAWEPQHPRGAVASCRELADVNTDQQDKGLQTSLVDRPRRRVAPRRHAAHDRHDAERRVRPAAGVDDLRAAQPVPRRDGGGAASTGRRPDALHDVYVQHAERRAGAAVGVRDATARPTRRSASTTRGSSSRRRSRSTCRPACRCRRRRARSTDAMARIGVPTTMRGTFQGTARAFQAVARRASRG